MATTQDCPRVFRARAKTDYIFLTMPQAQAGQGWWTKTDPALPSSITYFPRDFERLVSTLWACFLIWKLRINAPPSLLRLLLHEFNRAPLGSS